MADEKKEKRNLLDDIQKNIIDKIGNENIMEGDISRYKIPEKLPEVPIKTIERSKKKVIEDESEFEKAFNYGMQKAYERNKLPTKYTKEGLLQAALTFTNVGMAPMLEKYKQDQDPEKLKKRKYIEGYTDIAKSIMRGGPNFVKGASEFVLGPIDYIFDSDFQTKFNKMMDTKEVLGEAETLPVRCQNYCPSMQYQYLLQLKLLMVQNLGKKLKTYKILWALVKRLKFFREW